MIYEASLNGVLRIILWIFIISFVIRLVARMALPLVVKNAEKKMQDRARANEESRRPQRREGDVTIETPARPGAKPAAGEYTDYVEIKD